ncbi:Spore germination protein GerPC [Paenibacillaceae bacterium GAS479]|nr:Spore germination protein GerPC [Paenibacillaceae bacterium GAS479]
MEHKESSAPGGVQQQAEAPQVHPNRPIPLTSALGVLTGMSGLGGKGGLGTNIASNLLGKSMAWPGLGGAFPGMMGKPGAGFPPKWPLYQGAVPGQGWLQQPGGPGFQNGGPQGSPFAAAPKGYPPAGGAGWPAPNGWPAGAGQGWPPPAGSSAGAGQNWPPPGPPAGPGWQSPGGPAKGSGPGWPAPGGPPPGAVAGWPPPGGWPAGAGPGWPGSGGPPPGAGVGKQGNLNKEEPISELIEGSNTFDLHGTTIELTPGGIVEIPGEEKAEAESNLQHTGQLGFQGSNFTIAPNGGLQQGGQPVGIGIPGLDPNAIPGVNKNSVPQFFQALDPGFPQQWEDYQGWPFSGPPNMVPLANNSASSPSLQAETSTNMQNPCSGNLQDPHCLQQCLGAMAAGLAEQQQLNLQLTAYMKLLWERLQELETKPSYTIEKLEYNFDQLKVEQLDGTLNIGMTAPSESQLQEFGQMSLPNKQTNAGAKVYPLPIPQNAKAGPNNSSNSGAVNKSIAAAKAQQPLQPQATSSQPATSVQPGLGNIPAPSPGLAPGAAAIPGFSGPPVSSMPGNGGAASNSFSQPGFIPASPGLGMPGSQSNLQPESSPFTTQPTTGSSSSPAQAAALGTAPSPIPLPGFTDVRSYVNGWLNESAHEILERAAKSSKIPLDPTHRQMVIEDVRRQLPERIHFYMNEELGNHRPSGTNPDNAMLSDAQLRRTAERTLRDAESALKSYVQQLARNAPEGRRR